MTILKTFLLVCVTSTLLGIGLGNLICNLCLNKPKKKHQIEKRKSSNDRFKLANLPNEVLVHIFSRLPVSILFWRLPRVCTRFYALSKVACLKNRALILIFGDRNLFFLVFGKEDYLPASTFLRLQNPNFHTLKFAYSCDLTAALCRKLVSTFPNVRFLKLSAYPVKPNQVLKSVSRILLVKWNEQLEEVYLTLCFDEANMSESEFRQKPNVVEHIKQQITKMPRVILRNQQMYY